MADRDKANEGPLKTSLTNYFALVIPPPLGYIHNRVLWILKIYNQSTENTMRKILLGAVAALLLFPLGLLAGTPSPEGAKVYIISPMDGDAVTSPLTVKFGLSGMGVAPAGVDRAKTGHHHLMINMASLPPMDKPLVGSENLVHFGGGQTETTIELKPGKHTLQLLLGDMGHVPHNPPVVSEKITIMVK